jgi:putative Ca2+/H+ antiporter (TMEM165/GDT1 family)
MQAFLVSTGLVALAEIGDKTQLLALVLASRFRRPWAIIAGILVATLANHALAGAAGRWASTLLTSHLDPNWIRWGLAAGFVAMAGWTLIPDKLDDDDKPQRSPAGAFMTTLVAFFLVEIGDKTQVATVALAARYPDLLAVVAGTTLGMMLANAPIVLLGHKLADRLPTGGVRYTAAACFLLLGIYLAMGSGPITG